MTGKIEFSTWAFKPDLHEAWHRETGEAIQFTRAERALLNAFIENSGRVLQRELLLDAVAGIDAEVADRSIDFIIHRLRRKLGDKARDPRYIATQYGEGYIWVAEPVATQEPAANAFLVVGPVRGLAFVHHLADFGHMFARMLTRELNTGTATGNTVVFDEDCPPPGEFHAQPPELALTLDFLETGEDTLECVLALRRLHGNTIICIDRIKVCDPQRTTRVPSTAKRVARELIDAIWHASRTTDPDTAAPEVAPVAVGLHEASEKLTGTQETWKDAATRLRRTLRAHPDDAEAQLMLASTLHSRYVLTAPVTPIDMATRRQDEIEIEHLVQTALPRLQDNGLFALTAAKLLYFVNKAHRPLALDIAEQAFAATTAFANAFAMVAQLRMWEGELDAAMQLYDQGTNLTREGSYFHLYFLVLKAQTELATGSQPSQAADTLFTLVPEARGQLGLLCPPTATIDVQPDIDAFMDNLDRDAATAVIRYQHHLVARHFQQRRHRHHVMHRPVSLLLSRFDTDIIPADIHADIPESLIG